MRLSLECCILNELLGTHADIFPLNFFPIRLFIAAIIRCFSKWEHKKTHASCTRAKNLKKSCFAPLEFYESATKKLSVHYIDDDAPVHRVLLQRKPNCF